MESNNIELITRMVIQAINQNEKKGDGFMVPIGVSARHIHLTQEHVEALFGPGYQLTKKKELMGGQFASNETVTIVGLKLRAIENVRILGPVRKASQVEVSATDAIKLGMNVPVRESDMIFSVIGENFGFIGCCLLIFIYMLLIFQMIQITFDTKNEFYAYISTGVIMMILFHVFENIGMNIGLLPLTGIPLPFVSQGGSALVGNMIGIGMIMSMRYHNKSYMFSNEKDFENIN